MASVIVTGSSRGIGRGVALRFARDGYDVAVNYVQSADAAGAVVDTIETDVETGAEAIAVQADVGDSEDAERLVDETVDAFGDVTHVVNNAGIDQHVYTEDLSPEDFDRVMDTNVKARST